MCRYLCINLVEFIQKEISKKSIYAPISLTRSYQIPSPPPPSSPPRTIPSASVTPRQCKLIRHELQETFANICKHFVQFLINLRLLVAPLYLPPVHHYTSDSEGGRRASQVP